MQTEVSIHLLQQQFYEFKKNSEDTIELHIAKIEELAERLRNLGEPLTEYMIIMTAHREWFSSYRNLKNHPK
ncbi:hypothetical protein FF38_04523 [Lucilia cuprina]|uniref:Uncharacterized protein n=1 Tax=Lucilia cuprina TaxID=7375 RepID=A0A0L0CMB4_LUCCU|nr:hypothetical protein FF38_04523 [Lucilia cuprina]